MATLTREEENTIRQLADYERISGIIWIVFGILQCLTLFLAIAGIWNIFAGRSALRMAKRIRALDPEVPNAFQPIGMLVGFALINLIFGGVIGIAFVIFDFFVRDRVLSNTHLFSRISTV